MDRRLFLMAAAGLSLCPLCAGPAAANDPAHWGYSGPRGPANWGGTCAVGRRQSPIDLAGATTGPMPAIQIGWSRAATAIANNGHTIEVAAGGAMTRGADSYTLVQFHFHRPSEHRIGGRTYPMEAHFVHTRAGGGRGVIGVMLQGGAPNAAFSAIVGAMPRAAGGRVAAPGGVSPRALLPGSMSYYSYAGSLTTPTPDCEENVAWMVLAAPVPVAEADIARFAGLFAGNARPVMPLQGRTIQRSP